MLHVHEQYHKLKLAIAEVWETTNLNAEVQQHYAQVLQEGILF